MTRLIVTMWTTLDGYVAGPDDAMDWLRADADLMDYEITLVEEAGVLLLGRITHADFASHWPLVAREEIDADEPNRRYARRLEQLDKVVASRSGAVATWAGTRRIRDITAAEIHDIKQQSDGDVIVYGSLSVIAALDDLDLVDEFHLVVHPVLLCDGRPLLGPGRPPMNLELIGCQPFSSGAVLMQYAAGTSEISRRASRS